MLVVIKENGEVCSSHDKIIMREKVIEGKVFYEPIENIQLKSAGSIKHELYTEKIAQSTCLFDVDSQKNISQFMAGSFILISPEYERFEKVCCGEVCVISDIDEYGKVKRAYSFTDDFWHETHYDHLELHVFAGKLYLYDVDIEGAIKRVRSFEHKCWEISRFMRLIPQKDGQGNLFLEDINERNKIKDIYYFQ